MTKCPCGSRIPEAQYDAQGIFLCYTCDRCEKMKLSHTARDLAVRRKRRRRHQ